MLSGLGQPVRELHQPPACRPSEGLGGWRRRRHLPRDAFTLTQQGLVPVAANMLTFMEYDYGADPGILIQRVQFFLDGTRASPVANGGGQGEQWALDVSRFAGKNMELKVIFPPGQAYYFDIHGFASIPEPPTVALLCMGMMSIFLFRARSGT